MADECGLFDLYRHAYQKGVLVTESGRTLASVYMNDPARSDDRLDAAGRAMHLPAPRAQ